jgi:hypothetical protein
MYAVDMDVNLLAVAVATIAQFAVGAVWYMFLFGKTWGKMHGFDALPKETQEKMMKEMGPWYGLQLFVTFVTTFMLAHYVEYWRDEASAYYVALMLLIGFVIPTQITGAIFGGAPRGWIWTKIAIMAGGSFASLMAAAAVFELF